MKTVQIPNKLYFRIGEVASLLTIKPYVLRYWETEFPDIKPSKSKSGQRLYKRRDVELLVKIKELLYLERFTINGARKRLKEVAREGRSASGAQIPLELKHKEMDHPHPEAQDFHGNFSGGMEAQRPVIAPALDHRKIFAKIKKDLEQVLETIKI